MVGVTKAERFKVAKAVFRVAHLPGAELSTCVAIAQAIVQEFGAHDGFSHFVVAATGTFTDRDYMAELANVRSH